jgi:hypothetical protein
MIIKIGKILTSPIKFSLVLVFSALPLFFATSLIFIKESKLSQIKEKIDKISNYATKTKKFRDSQKLYHQRIKKYNPEFIKENIESFTFLKNEIEELKNYLKYDLFKATPEVKTRYNFLTNNSNSLIFKEEPFKNNSNCPDFEEKQIHPVEMNFEDLIILLSLIEDKQINQFVPSDLAPMMVIKKIEIKKLPNTNLSVNNLCLVKRNFVKEEKP